MTLSELPEVMTLEAASEALSPLGVTLSGLRRARREGKLKCRRPGRFYVVTRKELGRYLSCPDNPQARDSISTNDRAGTSSATAQSSSGQDMAFTSALKLKALSRTTSQAEARPAEVVRLTPAN